MLGAHIPANSGKSRGIFPSLHSREAYGVYGGACREDVSPSSKGTVDLANLAIGLGVKTKKEG